jgi:hypothetical protein
MTRLEKTEKVVSIIQAIVTVSAIISAGIWFSLQRELHPKLNITHTVTYQPITEHSTWIHVEVGLTNIGKRRLILTRGQIRMQQILPLDSPLAKAIERGESLIPPKETRVTWPMLGDTYRPSLAQFLAVCRRSKWSKQVTHSPCLALRAMAGSSAACKISSACSNALC